MYISEVVSGYPQRESRAPEPAKILRPEHSVRSIDCYISIIVI